MEIPAARNPVDVLRESFGEAILFVKEFRGETTVVVEAARSTDVLDYRPERFAVSYHLLSMLYNRRLRVKVFAEEEDPRLPTATVVFPSANWLEREIADMMGIVFEGHSDQRRLLMPDNWYGHPHRRDYPLGKETVAFSFNEAEIRKHKPFATD